MNKTISDVQTVELLPPMLARDERVQTVASIFDDEIRQIEALQPLAILYANIDALPMSILQAMAIDGGVYGPEWFIAGTIEKRRQLVKDAFMLAKRRGTRWAVQRVFEIIGWNVELKEWFENGADPYTFEVSLLDITNIGMSEDQSKWLLSLIDTYKPVSRVLTSINLVTYVPAIQTNAKIGVYFKAELEG